MRQKAYNHTVAVGANDSTDNTSSFSCYWTWITFAVNVADAKLELYSDGALKASTLSGSNSIMVKACDASGNMRTTTVSVVQ